MSLSQNEATRFISVIDYRIEKSLGRGTVVEVTYGDVEAVSDNLASVYIGGDTNASGGFRIPAGMSVQVGDRVRVTIDPRGYRRIDEVLTTEPYPRLLVDPVRGTVSLGDGTAVPDLELSRLSPGGMLRLNRGLRVETDVDSDSLLEGMVDTDTNERFYVRADGFHGWGPGDGVQDTYLYRDGTNGLRTTSPFRAGGVVTAEDGLVLGSSDDTLLVRHLAGRLLFTTNGAAAAAEWGIHAEAGQRAKYDLRAGTDVDSRTALWGDATKQGIDFGPGNTVPDTTLYRSGVGELTTDGDLVVAGAVRGTAPVRRVYTANATWTKPAGLTHIEVEVQGAGGGGGGTASTGAGAHAAAGGGGGGGYVRKLLTAADLAGDTTFDVTVGSGGGGGAAGNNSGAAGGSSSFAGTGITTVSGSGGTAGSGGASSSGNDMSPSGVGGSGSGGDYVVDGGDGTMGAIVNSEVTTTGGGGGAFLGGATRGRSGSGAGVAGHAYGGGGGGAVQKTASSGALGGGDGANGIVIVTEHYAS